MCVVVGAQLKADYNQVQEEWLEDPENLEKWEQQSISAGDRRILITHWLADAAERFRKRGQAICASSWARTGCGMSMDGSGDDAIVVSGVNNYSFAEPTVAADESAFVGIDEAEAKQADPEQPPTSKREDKKDQEEEDEDEEEEEEEDEEDEEDEDEDKAEEDSDPWYWVQCDLPSCQKWRRLPTAWGDGEFKCGAIRLRCGQMCDSCQQPRCVCKEE